MTLLGTFDERVDGSGQKDERRAVARMLDAQIAQNAGGVAELVLLECLEGVLVALLQDRPVRLAARRHLVEFYRFGDVDDADLSDAPAIEGCIELRVRGSGHQERR